METTITLDPLKHPYPLGSRDPQALNLPPCPTCGKSYWEHDTVTVRSQDTKR